MKGITDQAYSKLNGLQREYLKTISTLLKRARENALVEEVENLRGKMRGYLTCLRQMEIVTDMEMKALYLYFNTNV